MPITKTLSTTTLNSFLVPRLAGGVPATFNLSNAFQVGSNLPFNVGDVVKTIGGGDRYAIISSVSASIIFLENIVDSTGVSATLVAGMTTAFPGFNSSTLSPINAIKLIPSKTTAKRLDVHSGRIILVGGLDGGLFEGVTGAALGTYADDGGSFCGTKFIKNGANGSSAWVRKFDNINIEGRWFGVFGGAGADELAGINLAVTAASVLVGTVRGNKVILPTNEYLISSTLITNNDVEITGNTPYGTVIKPHPTFTGTSLVQISTGAGLNRAAKLSKIRLDSRGKNMSTVLLCQAQATAPYLDDVVIDFDGTTESGILVTSTSGLPLTMPMGRCEINSASVFATATGIKLADSSLSPIVLNASDLVIKGTFGSVLFAGIDPGNNMVNVVGYRAEHVTHMVVGFGAAKISMDTCLGSTTVVNMFTMAFGFVGSAVLRNLVPNLTLTNIVNDAVNARHIPSSYGTLASYETGAVEVSAKLTSGGANVTGNSTVYTVVYNTEDYDYESNYNTGVGVFTAPKPGRYLVNTNVRFGGILVGAFGTIKIVTTAGDYWIHEGSFSDIDTASNIVSLSGSCIVSLAVGNTIQVQLVVSGQTQTIGMITSGENKLQISYLGR